MVTATILDFLNLDVFSTDFNKTHIVLILKVKELKNGN